MTANQSHPNTRRRPASIVIIAALAAVSAGLAAIGLAGLAGAEPSVDAQTSPAPSAFVPIDSFRAVDTRRGADPRRLVASQTITVTADEDVDGQQIIPDEATAVTFNITAVDTRRTGYFQVTTANRELGNTSTVNWVEDGQNVANSGVTAVFASDREANEQLENTFAVFIDGDDGAAAHLVIDITGYFVVT